jgi:hypothetical protein
MGGHQYRDRPGHPPRAADTGWHAITIAPGIVIGAIAAARWLDRHDRPTEPMYTFAALAAVPRPTLFVAAAEAG